MKPDLEEAPHPLRHAPDRAAAPRQLHGRARELGPAAGQYDVLLHRSWTGTRSPPTTRTPARSARTCSRWRRDWLAAGLDPERSVIFIQSLVPEHAELHLLLSMIMPVPWLERVPTYKEQQQQHRGARTSRPTASSAIRVLQTADIIIYKADAVPVGEDQAPHIELTREIVRRFNNLYGAGVPRAADAAHRRPAHPRHRRPQDVEVVRQRDLPQGRPGDACARS